VNTDQIMAIVRQVLTVGGTYIVAKGWLPGDTVNELVGGVAIILSSLWSWKNNSTAATLAAAEQFKAAGAK
jgi:hypothetical protein